MTKAEISKHVRRTAVQADKDLLKCVKLALKLLK